jgi:hypothetical protein
MPVEKRVVIKRSVNVECPRGHRIGTVTVCGDGDQLRISRHVKGLTPRTWADVWQHDPDTDEIVHLVKIQCARSNCGYKGQFAYSTLAAV